MFAPMEGISHPDMRDLIAERGGLGIVCTEFVRVSRSELSADRLRREVRKTEGLPLSVQVMGNDAAKMAEAAEVIAEAGTDVVDINLGCPMPRIVRKGVGAAMLKDPELLHRVVSAMRERTRGTLLSAKIRAGFDDSENVVAIARVVEAAGVDYLVVHPRRRCDFYEGVADWRIVRLLRESLRIPVVGNGDVWYAADALRMERETGCDAVMIGRPALRNPWIFAQIAALRSGESPMRPNGADVVGHLETVRRRCERAYSPGAVTGRLKELLRYVARAIPEGTEFARQALRLPDSDAILRAAERLLAPLPAEALDLDAFGSLALERSGSAVTP